MLGSDLGCASQRIDEIQHSAKCHPGDLDKFSKSENHQVTGSFECSSLPGPCWALSETLRPWDGPKLNQVETKCCLYPRPWGLKWGVSQELPGWLLCVSHSLLWGHITWKLALWPASVPKPGVTGGTCVPFHRSRFSSGCGKSSFFAPTSTPGEPWAKWVSAPRIDY